MSEVMSAASAPGLLRPGAFCFMQADPESLASQVERENSAKVLCGGLLGDCYVLMEIIDGLMTEALVMFRRYPWYRQQLKHDLRMAHRSLHGDVQMSCVKSSSGTEFMREMADRMAGALAPDIFRMENGILIELGRLGVRDAAALAKMEVVELLLQYCGAYYDDVISYCCRFYGTYDFYDSWYSLASCRPALFWWGRAVDAFGRSHVDGVVDLNSMRAVHDGLMIIQGRLQDDGLAARIREEVTAVCDPGAGQAEYERAVEVLRGPAAREDAMQV